MDKKFSDLVIASMGQPTNGRVLDLSRPKLAIAGLDGGQLAVEGSADQFKSVEAIQTLMRELGSGADFASMAEREKRFALASAVREPIRTLARYKAWTMNFFAEDPRGPADDNRIPVDSPIGKAWESSPEGRPQMIRVGVQQWTRPSFTMIDAGLEIGWGTLQTAGWAVLQRRMEETADAIARKVDTKAKAVLAAALLPGQSITSSGSLLKNVVDYAIKYSTINGFPITQAAINPARLMDMSGWTNGSTAALPYIFGPARGEELYKNLFADGYGNIRWFLSHSVPMDEVWLGGEPSEIGYHQTHGPMQSASDVDIERKVDKHIMYEDNAWYVGNVYNLWKITIA